MNLKSPLSPEDISGFIENKAPAIEKIIAALTVPLHGFILSMVKDKDTAEDLVQETFVKAWKARKKFNSQKNFKTWLFTIGRNATIDFFRRKREAPLSQFENEDLNPLDELFSEEPSEFLEQIDSSIDWQLVKKALESLPPLYETVLRLRYKEDFSFEAIAEILDRPAATVRSQHMRALSILRKQLSRIAKSNENF